MVILIVLLALSLLTGVVYAIGRLTGYIPGIGLVDQSTPIRVLAEPVLLTRDGIMVTVEEAVLSSDKTVIRFTVNNIPLDKLSQDLTECGAKSAGLKLSDSSSLQTVGGYGLNAWGSGYEDRFTFEQVPAGMNEATFILPCIQNSLPGTLPENWELPLHFVSAPPEMTVIPVIEVTPSQEASSGNPLVIEKVIETENGYILAGTFSSAGLPQDAQAESFSNWPKIIDANGQEIQFTFANYELDLPFEKKEKGVFPWAFEVEGKQFNWPLTIMADLVAAEYQNIQTKFEFDTEAKPPDDHAQELDASGKTVDYPIWNVDIGLGELGGYPVRVVRIIRRADGYEFYFKSSAIFHGIDLQIEDSIQGLTGMDGPGDFASEVKFAGKIPSGKLTVLVSRPVIATPGYWQLQWQPENATHTSPVTLPALTQAPQACLTVDSWNAALANPALMPIELNRKVVMSENDNLYIARLDGSEKQMIKQEIWWASPSPDGSQIVYSENDGLYIEDIATGESHIIPNTITNDAFPSWSPDGTGIAFMRSDGFDIYTINQDGSNLQRVVTGPGYGELIGWSSDGASLFYSVEVQDGTLIMKLDLESGAASKLFTAFKNGSRFAAISPNGTEIAFTDGFNKAAFGVYISELTGSNRRLVAQMNDNWVGSPLWSPDGKWLVAGIIFTQNGTTVPATALVNTQTCQIIPLPITGTILSWVP
jgi:Tol biopolymer transport system component